MSDIGTTQRKRLTPTQRLKLFEAHGGKCALCGLPIKAGDRWIVEHMRALGLGGTNDGDNLAPVHMECAASKTAQEDLPRIAKAKRAKIKQLGIKKNGRKIRSAGFASVQRERAIDKSSLPTLPRRSIYKDA